MFREAATLILTCGMKNARYPADYGVLLLKRSSKLKFMPNTFIFPGGAVSKSDSAEKWRDQYSRKEIALLKPRKAKVERPPLYQTKQGELDKDLSLRISSIRECFEESGILFLEKNGTLVSEAELPNRDELSRWRKTVESDSSAFYDLCCELDAWPKVADVFDWSNWLTPPSILPYRFDTAFYIASIPEIPSYARQDGGETVELEVMNPFDALARQANSQIILHPPQFVELSRMAKFFTHATLMDYAKTRQDFGLKRWCPNQIYFKGCRISAMEGDDLHVDKIEGPVDDTYEGKSEETNAHAMTNLSRTVWNYELNEKGKKVYKTMFTKNNLFYFDKDTLMTTPMDHESLDFIINQK